MVSAGEPAHGWAGTQRVVACFQVWGSGDITLTATETAKGAIQGSGDVTVHGGADCNVAVAGSGDVNC